MDRSAVALRQADRSVVQVVEAGAELADVPAVDDDKSFGNIRILKQPRAKEQSFARGFLLAAGNT